MKTKMCGISTTQTGKIANKNKPKYTQEAEDCYSGFQDYAVAQHDVHILLDYMNMKIKQYTTNADPQCNISFEIHLRPHWCIFI